MSGAELRTHSCLLHTAAPSRSSQSGAESGRERNTDCYYLKEFIDKKE